MCGRHIGSEMLRAGPVLNVAGTTATTKVAANLAALNNYIVEKVQDTSRGSRGIVSAAAGTRVQSACRPDQSPAISCGVCALQRSRHEAAPTDGARFLQGLHSFCTVSGWCKDLWFIRFF